MFIFFGLIVIFVVWFQHQSKKSAKNNIADSSDFWRQEHKSNMTRRLDLDSINYLVIPFDKLPMDAAEDPAITSLQEELRALGESRILNLTGVTNTDLKLRFGLANLEPLSKYEENFTRLCRLLNNWASCLYGHGQREDALSVLLFALSCKSDISASYILLAKIYRDTGDQAAIDRLIDSLSFFDAYRLQALRDSLSTVRNS